MGEISIAATECYWVFGQPNHTENITDSTIKRIWRNSIILLRDYCLLKHLPKEGRWPEVFRFWNLVTGNDEYKRLQIGNHAWSNWLWNLIRKSKFLAQSFWNPYWYKPFIYSFNPTVFKSTSLNPNHDQPFQSTLWLFG